MKNTHAMLCALLSSAACGPVSEIDLAGTEPAAAAASEPEALRGALETTPHTLLGVDCGTVVTARDGTYVLSEITQLQAIDSSGCSYFNGNVEVAFTSPTLPASLRYLFDVKNVVSVSGSIKQGKSKQLVTFAGLESAGSVEVSGSYSGCGYEALKTVERLTIYGKDCSFPALHQVTRIEVHQSTRLSGFPTLQTVPLLVIHAGRDLTISGFKELRQASLLAIDTYSTTGRKITGSFPKLETLGSLDLKDADLGGFTLPKLTTITDVYETSCTQLTMPFVALQQILRTWTVNMGTLSGELVGPPLLTSLGGLQAYTSRGIRISGFPKLTTTSGTIWVRSSMGLTISGFDALTSAGSIDVSGPYLSLSGFSKLARMTGGLSVNATKPDDITTNTVNAFAALTEVQGDVLLYLDKMPTNVMPLLKTVGGSLRFKELGTDSLADKGFPKLETVGADLIVENQASAFNVLKRVEGTLKILDVPYSYLTSGLSIPGFKKLTFVGKDAAFDKNAESRDVQRLLDRLVGFTGKVSLE